MKEKISKLLKIKINKISIKATTNEKIGFRRWRRNSCGSNSKFQMKIITNIFVSLFYSGYIKIIPGTLHLYFYFNFISL